MLVRNYLNAFATRTTVTLVGPLYRGAHDFTAPMLFIDAGSKHRQDGRGISIGDGDSAGVRMQEALPVEKDVSDLGYALQQIPAHYQQVDLFGFLGGRRDHELFNLGEAHHFLAAAHAPTLLRFDNDIFGVSKGEWQFYAVGTFSLACLRATTLSLRGECRYPIAAGTRVQALSSFGLSNIGQGKVALQCRHPVFILRSEASTELQMPTVDAI